MFDTRENRALIIAEAGVNNNGSLELACRMADAAKDAGADIVKFQIAKPEKMISRHAKKAEYQKATTGADDSQLEMVRKLMMPYNNFVLLKEYCEKIGIEFLSTAFDMDSVDFLRELGCPRWKIPSGEITNYPYLVKVAALGEPIILSTGMSEMEEVYEAVSSLKEHGAGEITLLHCTTEYPAPFEDVNLRAMIAMRDATGCAVGYSDHTRGIEVSIAAVAMGATVIEKHFTLNRNMEGPDHKASLEPEELAAMVHAIRNLENALGDGIKRASASEIKNMPIARKSIIAARNIAKGELLTEKNITTKRPGNGISPMCWNEVIGTRAIRDFGEDELIEV